ncbi:hypothetical protein ARMGADRAFT_921188 [Armillaria gallica]|uniref:Uncharacterized protein n=1 Tax=Armillaria gallica TaxID=47427 RepID=A0A2H3DWB3_ARMGA|nr:hypothetical protein ARMGADRAFT_921188 [Armillaria gallica]
MREQLRFLSQSIMITGFNSMTFDDTINALEIQHTGEWEFHQGQLLEWTPNQLQGYNMLELSNRYLRSWSKTKQETGIPINNDVDSKGVLTQLAGNTMIHTEENIVRYYRGILQTLTGTRYMMTKPHTFRTGDIIEAQFSIVFVKCKGNNMKMKMILQAIAMVNCEHMMVSTMGDHRMYMTNCYVSECKP